MSLFVWGGRSSVMNLKASFYLVLWLSCCAHFILYFLCFDFSYFVCVDFTHLVLLWLHIFWWLFRLLMSLRLDHFGSPEKEKLFFAEIWSKIKEITLRFITDKRPPQGDMVIKVVEIQTKSDISAVKHSKGVYNQTCSDIPAVRHSKGVCTQYSPKPSSTVWIFRECFKFKVFCPNFSQQEGHLWPFFTFFLGTEGTFQTEKTIFTQFSCFWALF